MSNNVLLSERTSSSGPSVRLRRVALAAAIALALAALFNSNVRGQERSDAFWNYDAIGPVTSIQIADQTAFGHDDILVVSERRVVARISAGGSRLWSRAFTSPSNITWVADLAVTIGSGKEYLAAVATEADLFIIDGDGSTTWSRSFGSSTSTIAVLNKGPGQDSQLVLVLANGRVLILDISGRLDTEFLLSDAAVEPNPLLDLEDLDGDGSDEIVVSYFSSDGFGRVSVYDASGTPVWNQSESGQILTMSIVSFGSVTGAEVAVGTSLGRVVLFTSSGSRRWPVRTPNKPVTALATGTFDGNPLLLVGTDSGSLLAFDALGRRLWTRSFSKGATQAVKQISPIQSLLDAAAPVALSVLLEEKTSPDEQSLLLLNRSGRQVSRHDTVPSSSFVALTDLNHDGIAEIVSSDFATVSLADPGIGSQELLLEWQYRVGARPTVMASTDLNIDGTDELLLANSEGRMVALAADGTLVWQYEGPGQATVLQSLRPLRDGFPMLVAGFSNLDAADGDTEGSQFHLIGISSEGNELWRREHGRALTALAVGDINQSGSEEILVGDLAGAIFAYSPTGELIWQSEVTAAATSIEIADDVRGAQIVVSTRTNTIESMNSKGQDISLVSQFLSPLLLSSVALQNSEDAIAVNVVTEDGLASRLNLNGLRHWSRPIRGIVERALQHDDSLLVLTTSGELSRVGAEGRIVWVFNVNGSPTELMVADLDGDHRDDVVYVLRDGTIAVISWETGAELEGLGYQLAPGLYELKSIRNAQSGLSSIIVSSSTGVVRSLASLVNVPPLLVEPRVDVAPGRYNIEIRVIDIESDDVALELETLDPQSKEWVARGEFTLIGGRGLATWPVVDPPGDVPVEFRITFSDGKQGGSLQPAHGPQPVPAGTTQPSIGLIALAVGVPLAVIGIVVARRLVSPAQRARRLIKAYSRQPSTLFGLLSNEYRASGASPDFLLAVAQEARKQQLTDLAGLADALYLVRERSPDALALAAGAVSAFVDEGTEIDHAELWHRTYSTLSDLARAPSPSEATLSLPELEKLDADRQSAGIPLPALAGLILPLISLRDGLRVGRSSDYLSYLDSARGLIGQLQHNISRWPPHLDTDAVGGILQRLGPMIEVERQEVKGQAILAVTLVSKRVISRDQTPIVLEIANHGRAAAENISLSLEPNAAYDVATLPETIPILPPGGSVRRTFELAPRVTDVFRIRLELGYQDRTGATRRSSFADMVRLLHPVAEFVPVENPYSPGTPLRGSSPLFVGRDDLFNFIEQNVGRRTQPNVLMLVGQRRTGKTSLLLRLPERLPEHIVPVYIDCQSLGVSVGITGFLRDLARAIADTMVKRGLEPSIPGKEKWSQDPVATFESEVLRENLGRLPPESRFLLVFDEFEAMEDLISRDVLPDHLLSYLRHLIQHIDGLSFIFAGTHRLEEMAAEYWSVFFNLALYKEIGFLEAVDARALVCDPVSPMITYDDLSLDRILQVTAGHPYFLQLVCYSLVNHANSSGSAYVTISDVNAAIDDMLRLGEVHFAYLWRRSNPSERALLLASSQVEADDPFFRPAEALAYLSEYGIQLSTIQLSNALDSLLSRQILEPAPEAGASVYRHRIGLVPMWIARNKSAAALLRGTETK